MPPPLGDEVSPGQLNVSASLVPDAGEVYTHFSKFVALAKERFEGELGGKLLLYGPLDARGAVVTLAANIAGAATLGVDADPERLRQGIRYGFCDFVVNHLDEALRILKNEVRKKQPVSVCVEGDFAATLSEVVERGLQPDMLDLSEDSAAVETLTERGATTLEQSPVPKTRAEEITWTAASASALWLPKVDELATQILPAGDERSRWLKLAPGYLGRRMAGKHYLQMTNKEATQFAKLVEDAMASGTIGTKIMIQRRQL